MKQQVEQLFSKTKRNIKLNEQEKFASPIFSFKNLLRAYYRCRETKRRSISAAKFEIIFEKELLKMKYELINRTYHSGPYICFAISEPKIREVWAAEFRDRILHHLLVGFLEPIWEKKFIFHSYACRPVKGAHRAIKHLKKKLKKFGSNSLTRQAYLPNFYLQIDVRSFFMSIDKNILYRLIKKQLVQKNGVRKIMDRNETSMPKDMPKAIQLSARKQILSDVIYLTKLIIFENPTSHYSIRGDRKLLKSIPREKSLFFIPENKGLPIGNYTSQFFANVYLNEVDQFIKHQLGCHYYYRYMDDFLLLHQDKKQLLKWQKSISKFLERKLKIYLHPKKQILQSVSHGMNFLGYIVKPDYILSRKRIVSSLRKKLHYFNKLIDKNASPMPDRLTSCFQTKLFLPSKNSGLLSPAQIKHAQAVINSYYGHFKHANCFKLRKSLYYKYFKELKNYFTPVDKNFSHFIITDSIKNYLDSSLPGHRPRRK